MKVEALEFGSVRIDGVDYPHDVVIEGGRVRKRRKGPSKSRREEFGHTPLTGRETIPWHAKRLWIGTGFYGSLPVTDDVREQAQTRGVELLLEKTPELVARISKSLPAETNLILHVTC
jgi:hypothetical protein